MEFPKNVLDLEWEQTKSPAGATQWTPKPGQAAGVAPDAHDPTQKHALMMLTTDLALKADPAYAAILKRFRDDPDAFAEAFARAWFKLTHRDMGPRSRYLGALAPTEDLLWQDPLPPSPAATPSPAPAGPHRGSSLAGPLAPG